MNPLACLLDHSCHQSEQVSKGEISIDVILTNGHYQLIIYDQEENSVRRWLTHSVGLSTVPFTFELQAVPIVQNEERVMCGDKFYLTEEFIQQRFIDQRGGHRFTFEDDILISLVNSTQRINLTPEEDMLLKISSKQAYGINMAMSLCTDMDCLTPSTQVGNTEVLFTTLEKGRSYYVDLDYTNSIIALTSFFDCPHVHLKVSMIKVEEAQKYISDQEAQPRSWIENNKHQADAHLNQIFSHFASQSGLAENI